MKTFVMRGVMQLSRAQTKPTSSEFSFLPIYQGIRPCICGNPGAAFVFPFSWILVRRIQWCSVPIFRESWYDTFALPLNFTLGPLSF